MSTLSHARRVMRPHPSVDDMPPACAGCQAKIPQGVVFSRGKYLGSDAIVGACRAEPPPHGQVVRELEFGDREPTPTPPKPRRGKAAA